MDWDAPFIIFLRHHRSSQNFNVPPAGSPSGVSTVSGFTFYLTVP